MPDPFLADIEIHPPHPTRCGDRGRSCDMMNGTWCKAFRCWLDHIEGAAVLERCHECLEAERRARG